MAFLLLEWKVTNFQVEAKKLLKYDIKKHTPTQRGTTSTTPRELIQLNALSKWRWRCIGGRFMGDSRR
jgi:hypothetical protein